jgi:DNA-binding response OmpR family regulator
MKTNKRILIIDDEPDLVYLLETQLQMDGYQTVSASDGEEGLRIARKTCPSLIILDLNLPKLAGLEVCRAIREDCDALFDRTSFSFTPIIMLTANRGEADRIIGNVLGADEYFTKPFRPEIFLSKVRELCEEGRS